MDIDVVVTWVNGSDEAHRAKRLRFQKQLGGRVEAPERVAVKKRRFSDNDEIRFCLRSIRNHAPWVRTIWIVTDNQVPPSLDRALAEQENVRIVDHSVIFRGFEHLLPTFNSLSIETMLWRIPGLAEHFIYMNDDMMLVGPVEPKTFFRKPGEVILRGGWADWSSVAPAAISFHGANKLAGAAMLGISAEHFFSSVHVAHPMWLPAMRALFQQFEPKFAANAAYRFRDRSQFWPMSLHDHFLLREGRAEIIKPKDALHFSVKLCRTASAEELTERLERLADDRITLTCINYMEAVVEKVPDALRFIDQATGPVARFEMEAIEEPNRAA